MRLLRTALLILILGIAFAVFAPVMIVPSTQNLQYCDPKGCVNAPQYESLTHAAFCIGGIYRTVGGYSFEFGCFRS